MKTITSRAASGFAASAIALACQSAFAQSSVTLYGVADVSVRYLTNANANNDGKVFMTNGAVTNSRFGLKGTEELGGGLKAVFRLESGVELQNGQYSDSQRQFNRAAYVGLANQYGAVTLGRQKTPLFDMLGDVYDPLTVGNYFENAWLPVASARASMRTTRSSTPARSAASRSARCTRSAPTPRRRARAASPARCRAIWARATCTASPRRTRSGRFPSTAAISRTATTPATSRRSGTPTWSMPSGRQKCTSAICIRPMTRASWTAMLAQRLVAGVDILKGSGRRDDGPFGGVTWQVTPALLLTGAFYYDHMKNAAIGGGATGSGNRYTGVALQEYALSKRTEVYGTVDFNKVTGAGVVELPGRSNQTGVSVGLRTCSDAPGAGVDFASPASKTGDDHARYGTS